MFSSQAGPAQPARDRPAKGRKLRLVIWLGFALALAALLAPMFLAGDLRGLLAQRRLDAGWQPEHGVIPRLQSAYSQDEPLPPAELEGLRAELSAYQGAHPEFFWLTLALLEAKAGRMELAKADLERAKALDPSIVNLAKGPEWNPWRKKLGL